MGIKIIDLVPSAAVDTDDTMDFAYPSGVIQSRVKSGGEVLSVEGHGTVAKQAADTFTVSYDSDSATVTWKGDTSIPAGTKVSLQITVYDQRRITDSSGGTPDSSEPVTISTVTADDSAKHAIATLAQEVNRLSGEIEAILARIEV